MRRVSPFVATGRTLGVGDTCDSVFVVLLLIFFSFLTFFLSVTKIPSLDPSLYTVIPFSPDLYAVI